MSADHRALHAGKSNGCHQLQDDETDCHGGQVENRSKERRQRESKGSEQG
jgi:hypothetical protein